MLDSAEVAAFPLEVSEGWQICGYILSQLSETLVSASNARVFDAKFKLRASEHAAAIKGMSGDELMSWLKVNGYGSDAYKLVYKLIVRALVFDLVEFATEAVRCTIRGPLTVAIALLRKPFKENLFYLEWILADPKDVFTRFMNGDVEALSLGKNMDQVRKTEIIRAAMVSTPYGEWIAPEFLYELRFEKRTDAGLEPSWQKANHLITTMGVLRTERENFNFVFSTGESRHSQWLGFYATVPLLLFHALQVFVGLFGTFAKRASPISDITPLRTLAGMLLWMRSGACRLDLHDVRSRFRKVLTISLGRTTCPHCRKRYSVREANIRSFFQDTSLQCFTCGRTTSFALDAGAT